MPCVGSADLSSRARSEPELGFQGAWTQACTWPLPGCWAAGKLLHPADLQFSHKSNDNNKSYDCIGFLWGWNGAVPPNSGLTLSKLSIHGGWYSHDYFSVVIAFPRGLPSLESVDARLRAGRPPVCPWTSSLQWKQGSFLTQASSLIHGCVALGVSLQERVGLAGWGASWRSSPALGTSGWTLFVLRVWEESTFNVEPHCIRGSPWLSQNRAVSARAWFHFQAPPPFLCYVYRLLSFKNTNSTRFKYLNLSLCLITGEQKCSTEGVYACVCLGLWLS